MHAHASTNLAAQTFPRVGSGLKFGVNVVLMVIPLLLVAGGLFMLIFQHNVTPAARFTGSLFFLIPGLLASAIIFQPFFHPFRVRRCGDEVHFSGGWRLAKRRVAVLDIQRVTRQFRQSQTEGGLWVPEHTCRVVTTSGTVTAYRGYYAWESAAFAAAIAQAAGVAVEVDPSAVHVLDRVDRG